MGLPLTVRQPPLKSEPRQLVGSSVIVSLQSETVMVTIGDFRGAYLDRKPELRTHTRLPRNGKVGFAV